MFQIFQGHCFETVIQYLLFGISFQINSNVTIEHLDEA